MTTTVRGSRRSSMEIIQQILKICDKGGVNKTSIMYKGNLSYDQLQRYLGLLSSQELLHRAQEGRFTTTPKGQGTLRHLSELLEDLGGLEPAAS